MHLNGLMLSPIGTGYIQPITNTVQMTEAVERMVRGAAINAIREASSGLSGLSNVETEQQLDIELEKAITRHTLDGLSANDVEPLSDAEFKRELYSLITSGELSGLFSSITRAIKKVVAIPKKIIKKVVTVVKKVAKKVVKVVKKIAPVVAVGAMLYFGGPAAWATIKQWGATGYQMVSNILGSPGQPGGSETEIIMTADDNNEMIQAAAEVTRIEMQKRGVDMSSPTAMGFLGQVLKGELAKKKVQVAMAIQEKQQQADMLRMQTDPNFMPQWYAQQQAALPATGITKMLPWLAVAGGAALLMMG